MTRIAMGVREFLVLAMLALVAPLFVLIDVAVIGHGMPETSLTEFTQETLLLMSASLFGYGAWRYADTRGLFVLVAGLFGCMLVRELDWLFDMVRHGFWFWPAIAVAVASSSYARLACRGTVQAPLAAFIGTRPYCHLAFGLLVVLVFSRVFGSDTLVWSNLKGQGGGRLFSRALQEGLELFGYIFVACGSFLTFREKKGSSFSN